MNCVRFKPGVLLDPPTPAHARMLGVLDLAARMLATDLTVTCGREAHGADDPHTGGFALDVRAAGLPVDIIVRLHTFFRAQLGDAFFYVQYECPTRPDIPALEHIAVVSPAATAAHFHIQCKKGQTYPWDESSMGTTKA